MALIALSGLLLLPAGPARSQTGADVSAADDDLLRATVLPRRDPLDLAQRFGRLNQPSAAAGPSLAALPAAVGRVDGFWVMSPGQRSFREVSAGLRLISESAYWYVEQGLPADDAALRQSAALFDQRIYPLVRRYFGAELLPGIDGDPRITILLADLADTPAYYSSADEYPRQVLPRSNEREMLYLNLRLLQPGTPAFAATLAHELQHLIHWHSNPEQETWVDEGSAELATALVGISSPGIRAFERQPDTQLTAWSVETGQSAAHYQAAYLFMRYFLERYLVPDDLQILLARQARGPETFDQFLAERTLGTSFDDVFKDWAVANFLDELFPEGGRFGYRGLQVRAELTGALGVDSGVYRGQVHQYGTDFIELTGDGGDADVLFQGTSRVPLTDTQPRSGAHVWWSNRGDNVDSRLTRAFDLRGVGAPHLRFQLWHEMERDFDYGYVLVSTDQGQTWTSLCTSGAHVDDPTGNNLGCGFSGDSGGGDDPTWVVEEMDLSAFAGQEVLVRFEYVTDQAYNARGILLDDIAIPELGYLDDAESDAGWQSEGFIRSTESLGQTYSVRLLLSRGPRVEVADLDLDAARSGVARIPGLGSEITRAVIAVSGLAPRILESAHYGLELRRAGS